MLAAQQLKLPRGVFRRLAACAARPVPIAAAAVGPNSISAPHPDRAIKTCADANVRANELVISRRDVYDSVGLCRAPGNDVTWAVG